MTANGKGDRNRTANRTAYVAGWDRVYRRRSPLASLAIVAWWAQCSSCGPAPSYYVCGVPVVCTPSQLDPEALSFAIDAVTRQLDGLDVCDVWLHGGGPTEITCYDDMPDGAGGYYARHEDDDPPSEGWIAIRPDATGEPDLDRCLTAMVVTHEIVHWVQHYEGAEIGHYPPWYSTGFLSACGTTISDAASCEVQHAWCGGIQ